MTPRTFVDTNILVYAHDAQAGEKHGIAQKRIEHLWKERNGVLSLQVLQELYVTLTQKVPQSLTPAVVKEFIKHYSHWEVVEPTLDDLFSTLDLQAKHRFSLWDALIIQAAVKADCAVLLSEDLQHGQMISSLKIENPFRIQN